MNCGNLLATLPTVLAVGAVPVMGFQSYTLAASLFADWLVANEAFEAVVEDDHDEFERRWQSRWDIEKRLLAAPVENALD